MPIVNLANCCCLWIVAGGLLAGYLAQQNSTLPLSGMRGATVGLLAGIIGAFVWLIAALALDVVMAPLQERMVENILRSAADMPPEVREWLELMTERTSAPFRLAAGFAFQLLAGVVFSTVGGLLATVFFKHASQTPDGPEAP